MSYQHECLYCHSPIKENLKFCSKSHAAKFNNSKRTGASRKQQSITLTTTLKKKSKPVKLSLIDPNLYPKTKTGVIKYTALFLNKDKNLVTYDDVSKFKDCLEYYLNVENLSPEQIKTKLNFPHKNFNSFLTTGLGIKTKSGKEGVRNYCAQQGRLITDEKSLYWQNCQFTFNVFDYPKIIGYELLSIHKFAHKDNPMGLNRDHMISIRYGWENSIPSEIISHPANCHMC
jgi:hypothetical protein